MKRNDRKALMMVLAALLLMGFTGAYYEEAAPSVMPQKIGQMGDIRLFSGSIPWTASPVPFDRESLLQGGLMCIGTASPIPGDMPAQQVHNVRKMVGLYVPAAPQVALSEETIYALCDLCAENPLVHTWITDGARAPGEQYRLQNDAYETYRLLMPTAQALAKARIDVPDSGCSEHQLATAFDVQFSGTLEWASPDPLHRSVDGRWLHENAWRFGFIRRYPPEKVYITGVENEALHFRYVGRVHAAAMQTMNWCLEEYLAFLQTQKLLLITWGDVQYGVFSAEMDAQGAVFSLPAGDVLQISADGLGYAVCVVRLDQPAFEISSDS